MEKEVLNLILVEIREMKGDMKEVKHRLTNVEGRLTNLENDMSSMKRDILYVKELAEFNKETSESIRNVVTSHYMEFKKYIKSNETQHKLYDAKLLQFNKEN